MVSNEVVAPLFLERLTELFADRHVATVILPDGEAHKSLESFSRVMDALVRERFHRDCCVVALGGGVVGDLAGFAAACYQRGVDYVQIPTTLLAQVDSSVGGKTAVNHPGGKNLIGAFYQPRCVLADTNTLTTLPARELSAGLAEVIKYGLILDGEFFCWLEDHIAALNLGHTFGHPIEAATGYGEWLHGEAVGAGLLLAAKFAARSGTLSDADVARIENMLRAAALPTSIHGLAAEQLLDLMALDKKTLRGELRLITLMGIGVSSIVNNPPRHRLIEVLKDCGAV
jgi:3-dehydroquinate synthase